MKEESGDQGVGATAFDLPNGQHPDYINRVYHTKVKVPRPNNSGAMVVDHSKVMKQVLTGK